MPDEDLNSDHWEEFLPADPVYRRLHRGVRLDPEAVWQELRAFLCDAEPRAAELDGVDLIEDLMFWHAEAFVDRIAALVDECPRARLHVSMAHVGGVHNPGVERFAELQDRVLAELEEDGLIQRG